MTVQGRLRDTDCGLRFGLTVTKRVGHATERNRIKRRLRTVCQKAGFDYRHVDADIVVIGRRDILTADYDLLIDDLRRALRVVTKPRSTPTTSTQLKSTRPEESSPSSPTNGERRGHPNA
jgi:ribonuclease P protein component